MKQNTDILKKNIVYLAGISGLSMADIDRLLGKSAGYTSRLIAESSSSVPSNDVFDVMCKKFNVNRHLMLSENLEGLKASEIESLYYMDDMQQMLKDAGYVSEIWKGAYKPDWHKYNFSEAGESFAYRQIHASKWGLKFPGTDIPYAEGEMFDSEKTADADMFEYTDFMEKSVYYYSGKTESPRICCYSLSQSDFYSFKGRKYFGINYCFKTRKDHFDPMEFTVYDSWKSGNPLLEKKFGELLACIANWVEKKEMEAEKKSFAEFQATRDEGEKGFFYETDDLSEIIYTTRTEGQAEYRAGGAMSSVSCKEDDSFFNKYLKDNSLFCNIDNTAVKYVDFVNSLGANAGDDVKKAVADRIIRMCNKKDDNRSDDTLWLENVMRLPWGSSHYAYIDVNSALSIIEESHYGLNEVKDRIREILAVMKRTESPHGMIICLDGPPGVGKTSVAKSIAEAFGRKIVSISVPALDDGMDVLGDRETYKCCAPGRIMKAIMDAGSSNPVILLDEIDKARQSDGSRSPLPALLGVLDPSQNTKFQDTYFGFPYDLSSVVFILTANDCSILPRPLLDRAEIIKLSGYSRNEKKHIAFDFLIPKIRKKNGFGFASFDMTDEASDIIVDEYAPEPGVRGLEKMLDKLARHHIKEHISEKILPSLKVDTRYVREVLGKPVFDINSCIRADKVGTALGLSVSEMGGSVLRVEIAAFNGTGQLHVTGRLGNVIKESIDVAFSFLKSILSDDRRYSGIFEKKDFHLHIPEGSTPKDGPSAGITCAVALYSVFIGRPAKAGFAMTGEVNLCGEVTAVGGIREKILGALAAGISNVIIPEANVSDFEKLDADIRSKVKIFPVSEITSALEILF